MLKDRGHLEEKLKSVLKEIKINREQTEQLKARLSYHNILTGETQKIINGTTGLKELDIMMLGVLDFEAFEITQNMSIEPKEFFTEKELIKIKDYKFEIEVQKIEFPIIVENVLMLTSEDYITTMSIKQIVDMYNSNLLNYNFETQRNAKFQRRKDSIIQKPNINSKSVKEIAQHVLNGTYLPDTLTLNVLAGSSLTEKDEIIYNAKKQKLIINEAEVDILDGFHRITAFLDVVEKSPEAGEMQMQVAIKNYNTKKAQGYVAQINTINKTNKTHLKALKADRYADTVVKELMRESDLRGKISRTDRPSKLAGHLVSYSVLSDTIDEEFKLEKKTDALELAEKLTRFFDYLIGSYPEAFDTNIEEVRQQSLINHNNMFAGYVILAKRMIELDISFVKVKSILDNIDFNKNNPMWEEIGVLENKKITKKAKRILKQYFMNINLSGGEQK